MAAMTEARRMSALYELPMDGSRENVIVLSGQNLPAGALVSRAASLGIGGIVSVLSGTSPGDGTMTAIFAGPDVEAGAYLVQCTAVATNNGTFSVTTPSGKALPPAVMAGGTLVYRSSHINFTLTDGGTDFALTALFTVTVSTTPPLVIGGTGTGVMTAMSLGPDATPGNYKVINRVVIANGGDFEILAPDGHSIGRFNWSASGSTAAFTSRHINFTLSDATDYIAGNYFDVAVFNVGERGKGKVSLYAPGTYDGSHQVAGAMLYAVDATDGDMPGVIYARDAVLASSVLNWGALSAGEQESTKRAMAQSRGLVVRG